MITEQQLRELIHERQQEGCLFCYEKDASCLHFHHRYPKRKEFGISQSIKLGKTLAEVEQEISKTWCLCANCHAKMHREKCGTCGRPFTKEDHVIQYFILHPKQLPSGFEEHWTIDAFFHHNEDCDRYWGRQDWRECELEPLNRGQLGPHRVCWIPYQQNRR